MMNLPKLADNLLADGLSATFRESDAGPVVDIEIGIDALSRPLVMQVAAVEAETDPAVEMFQVFVGLPFGPTDDQLSNVVRHLPALNVLAPIGSLSVFADEQVIFYRHVALTVSGRLEVIQESIWLAHFAINLLVPPLMRLAELSEI